MKARLKRLVSGLPEYYLLLLVLLAGYQPPLSVNPISIGFMVIILLQIYFRNGISGVMLGGLFLLINLYMGAALISEFLEFPTFNARAAELIFGGGLLFTFNLLMSGIMIFKYTFETNEKVHETRST